MNCRNHNRKFIGGGVAPVTINALVPTNYIVVNCNRKADMVEVFIPGL